MCNSCNIAYLAEWDAATSHHLKPPDGINYEARVGIIVMGNDYHTFSIANSP